MRSFSSKTVHQCFDAGNILKQLSDPLQELILLQRNFKNRVSQWAKISIYGTGTR